LKAKDGISGLAEVALPVPVDKTFTYSIPASLEGEVLPGARVSVPFGRRSRTGYVVSLPGKAPPGVKLREITGLVDEKPLLTAGHLELARWMAETYVYPVGEVLRAMLPASIKGKGRKSAADLQASFLDEVERPELTAAQSEAFEAVREAVRTGRHERFLLYGVTGSGKTEVYLRCIEEVLGRGGSAVVLIPEIALVPQITARFRRRFGETVSVLHSRLTGPQRASIWAAAAAGESRVVIGARSAVFVPVADLGIIVIDEEQDSSFKQQEKPRYSAVETAAFRARQAGAVLLAGSATPSLESWNERIEGRVRTFELPDRPTGGELPRVEIVDMREKRRGISPQLLDALDSAIRAGRQGIVLINRRGHANCVQCSKCGRTERCSSCSISMTWHSRSRRLICHYCGATRQPPERCPECGSFDMVQLGRGTQKVESELANMLPGARVLRMDLDSTAGTTGHLDILEKFAAGAADILLGTQMVAKGHHFPNVTVVVLINADAGLNIPDFRASERTFQLLSQAAGRTGRGKNAGVVIVQTSTPEHYLFRHLADHDYPGFASDELELRRALKYPPAGGLMLLTVSARSSTAADRAAERTAKAVAESGAADDEDILGPVPAIIERIRGEWRRQILIRGDRTPAEKRKVVEEARKAVGEVRGSRVQWDVAPLDIF